MNWVYLQSEPGLLTVGFYDPAGKWHADSDHDTRDNAAARVAYLNGTAAVHRVLDEALNSGDGSYKP